MLIHSNLLFYFWQKLITAAWYIIHHFLTKVYKVKIQYKACNKKKLDLSIFYVYDCNLFVVDHHAKIQQQNDSTVFHKHISII